MPPGFSEQPITGPAGGGWSLPNGLQFGDDGRLFVWDRAGRVWSQENGGTTWNLFIDISEEVGFWGDFGLLGFTLDPNFRVNGQFYLMYVVDRHHLLNFGTPAYDPTANAYQNATIGRITRYTARASDGFRTVDLSTRHILLGESPTNGIPILYKSHGVGSLVFGTDGTLLASVGDGASFISVDGGSASETYYIQALADGIISPKENVGAFRSQMVDSLGGKILRLDPATGDGIPSNPFYDPAHPRAARSRVWDVGLRNPFRMTLRPGTGSHVRSDANPGVLYIGDVRWNDWECLFVSKGARQNFGWPSFEGIAPEPGYSITNVPNQDAPNPAFPAAGCSPYFSFNDLLKQYTTNPALQPPFNNPCAPGQKIPAAIPQFLFSPPALDWAHLWRSRVPIVRTWVLDASGMATPIRIDAPGSPVTGDLFPGGASVGGVWYTGTNFPTAYRNTYFHADYGERWIKNMKFDAQDRPVSVDGFLAEGGGVVALAVHPLNGSLYYVSMPNMVYKITHPVSGNLPPVASAEADRNFGRGPLTVQFTGKNSVDPEKLPLTFDWDFGDGTPHSFTANPSHVFQAAAGVPTRFDVTLTVTDSTGQTSTAALIISANNTPPRVTITSPVAGSLYPMTSDTVYDLQAVVEDTESSDAQLHYEWRTFLHHNNHEHQDATENSHVTTTVISPAGCDGINVYYYRIELLVTDASGLTTTREVSIFPDCGVVDTPPQISSIPDQVVPKDLSTGPLVFTVSDAEAAAFNLGVSGTSSNPTLVPAGNIHFAESGADRVVTVQPAAGESGTATITVTVSDGPNAVSTSFLLTVPANSLSVETPEDTAITLTLPAGDITGDLGYSIPKGPTNGTLSAFSPRFGTVTYTPNANYSGPDTLRYTVGNGTDQATGLVSFTVKEVNDAPVLTLIGIRSVDELFPWTATLTASDSDLPAQTLTYSLVNGPAGLAVAGNGVMSWTPTEAQGPGLYLATVRVTDNGQPPQSDTQQFTLVVNEVTPVWQIGTDDNPSTTPYRPYVEFGIENGQNDIRPGKVTRLPGDPEYVGPTNPAADDDFYLAGIYPSGFNGLAAELRVPNDEPPLAWERALTSADRTNRVSFILSSAQVTPGSRFRLSFEFAGGGTTAGGVGEHDVVVQFRNRTEGVTSLLSQRVSPPASMSVEFPASAVGASEGPNTIELVRTGPAVPGGSAWLLFDYLKLDAIPAVEAVNTPPTLPQPLNVTVDELSPVSVNLMASDSDLPAQTLTYSLVSGPSGLTVSPAGAVSWTPAEYQGPATYPVVVRVTDSGSSPLSATAGFSIAVREVNTAPTLAVANLTLNELTPLVLNLAGADADLPPNALTYSLVSGPAGLTVSQAGVVSWTPTEYQGPATFPVSVMVTDNGTPSLSSTVGFSIAVREVNAAPTLGAIADQTINELALFSVTLAGADGDLPPNTLTYSKISGPEGLTVSAGGTLSWTPTEQQGPGSYLVKVRVTDNGAVPLSADREFTLTVNEVPDLAIRTVWQVGIDDNPLVLPYTPTGEFSIENGRNDARPGTVTRVAGDPQFIGAANPGADDDFYFAGVYRSGFNGLPTQLQVPNDEPPLAWERALTSNDRTNRLHFVLDSTQVTPGSRLRLSFEFVGDGTTVNGVLQPPGGVHDLVVRFQNGADFATQLYSQQVPAKTNIVIEFLASTAGAQAGPNTIELVRTGPTAANTFSWLMFDVVRIEVLPSVNTPPTLTQPPNLTINELAPMAFNLAASDSDLPANTLSYSRLSGPEGLTVSSTGLVAWTPTELQGPGSYLVKVQVTDNGLPPLTDSKEFTLTVNEVPDLAIRAVWQVGTDDNPLVLPYKPTGEFSIENGRNDARPGNVTRVAGDPQFAGTANPGADDDLYFAGLYRLGFNGLIAELQVPNDEPALAWERALTSNDSTNRVHFVLDPSQVVSGSRLRLSFEFVGGGSSVNSVVQPGTGVHNLVVRWRNGSDIATQVYSQSVAANTNIVIEFLTSAAGAQAGPNTVELVRTGPAAAGVFYWLVNDYLRIEALPAGGTGLARVQPPSLAPESSGVVRHGVISLDGLDYPTLTYDQPEPVPAGAQYQVEVSEDLRHWSAEDVVPVSDISANGWRTITVRTGTSLGGSSPRFMRLRVVSDSIAPSPY